MNFLLNQPRKQKSSDGWVLLAWNGILLILFPDF